MMHFIDDLIVSEHGYFKTFNKHRDSVAQKHIY